MSTRKIVVGLGFAVVLVAPLAALADAFWETTNDEAGSRIVTPRFGAVTRGTAPVAVKPLQTNDISIDRQYVYLGEEGGWQLRPMQYAWRNGRLTHVDDPVGHMHRIADTRPLTEQERAALQRSAGQ